VEVGAVEWHEEGEHGERYRPSISKVGEAAVASTENFDRREDVVQQGVERGKNAEAYHLAKKEDESRKHEW